MLRPGDHADRLLKRAVVEGAEGLKAQEIVILADMVGRSVAAHVGVMLGLIEAPKEVDANG